MNKLILSLAILLTFNIFCAEQPEQFFIEKKIYKKNPFGTTISRNYKKYYKEKWPTISVWAIEFPGYPSNYQVFYTAALKEKINETIGSIIPSNIRLEQGIIEDVISYLPLDIKGEEAKLIFDQLKYEFYYLPYQIYSQYGHESEEELRTNI